MTRGLVALCLFAGCSLVNAYPPLDLFEESGGATGEAGATVTGGQGGQGGQGGEGGTQTGCTPEICAASANECQSATCLRGIVCDTDPYAIHTPCTGGVCNGAGQCVECLQTSDCNNGEFCERQACLPATCDDLRQNGNETGVDCGGLDCGPCENGQSCLVAADCISKLCLAATCMACTAHGDCLSSDYCEGGICRPKKPAFAPCMADAECLSNNCQCQGTMCACGS